VILFQLTAAKNISRGLYQY